MLKMLQRWQVALIIDGWTIVGNLAQILEDTENRNLNNLLLWFYRENSQELQISTTLPSIRTGYLVSIGSLYRVYQKASLCWLLVWTTNFRKNYRTVWCIKIRWILYIHSIRYEVRREDYCFICRLWQPSPHIWTSNRAIFFQHPVWWKPFAVSWFLFWYMLWVNELIEHIEFRLFLNYWQHSNIYRVFKRNCIFSKFTATRVSNG